MHAFHIQYHLARREANSLIIPEVALPADRFSGAEASRPRRGSGVATPGEEGDWLGRRDLRLLEVADIPDAARDQFRLARGIPGRETRAAPSCRTGAAVVDSPHTHTGEAGIHYTVVAAGNGRLRCRPLRATPPKCIACGSSRCGPRPIP